METIVLYLHVSRQDVLGHATSSPQVKMVHCDWMDGGDVMFFTASKREKYHNHF